MLTVACVLRKSQEYDIDYVERLRDGVSRHLSGARFVCLSDVDVPCERIPLNERWPGWWSKMELFAPHMKSDVLYFDLDTMIVGDLQDIAEVGCLTMLADFYHPNQNASGMMFLPEDKRGFVWEAFTSNPRWHMDRFGGDQEFLNEIVWGNQPARWQDILPGQVVSYKAHVRGNGVPEDARVVCFHGKPRPRSIGWNLNG